MSEKKTLLLSMASIVAAGVLARDDVTIDNARAIARKIVAISTEIIEEIDSQVEEI